MWVYKIYPMESKGLETANRWINEMRQDGWELVSVDQGIAYFKMLSSDYEAMREARYRKYHPQKPQYEPANMTSFD